MKEGGEGLPQIWIFNPVFTKFKFTKFLHGGGGEGGHWDFPPQTEFSNSNNYDVIIASTATIGHTSHNYRLNVLAIAESDMSCP